MVRALGVKTKGAATKILNANCGGEIHNPNTSLTNIRNILYCNGIFLVEKNKERESVITADVRYTPSLFSVMCVSFPIIHVFTVL